MSRAPGWTPIRLLNRKPAAPPVSPGFRATERRTPDRPCPNCGDPTPGNFCRTCGQRKVEVRVSLGRMLLEALDDQFSINSALPRTVGALLGRPGHLTREYMSGRIVRYIPPFRLYLVTSVLFFLALSLIPDLRNPNVNLNGATVNLGSTDSAEVARPAAPPAPVREASAARLPTPPPAPPAPQSNWLRGRLNTGNATIDSIGNARLEHFRRMEPTEAVRQVISGFLGRIPQVMFLLLPIFAAILMVLYAGSGRFYVEHFVFALHVHASAFVIFLAMIALVHVPEVGTALLLWLMLYVYLAMKKVYRQGWFLTGLKYTVLGLAYVCLLTVGAGLTLLLTVLLA
jgi:hypothetical protein